MKWGILGALDAEIELIRKHMDIRCETPLLGTVFYEGTVSGHDIVLVCCGVGKVNAAVCAATVFDKFGADCIVNVGIAGAMQHGLHLLDVVISSETGFHDQDEVMLAYHPKRAFFPADETLAALCMRACESIPEMAGRFHRGRIVSGDKFVNDIQTKQAINERFAPACVEMEGAAIGHTAFLFGKPYLVIRTMSDTADDDADETYDNFIDEAARTSATLIVKMLALSDASESCG